MKRLLYISLTVLIVLTCCNKSTKTCLDMPSTTYSDSEFTLAKWAGCRWAQIPQDELDAKFKTEFLLLDSKQEDIDIIISELYQEFGEPFVTSETLPKDYLLARM